MEWPDSYWVTSFVDGDFDNFPVEEGEKIAEAMLAHKQCVEVKLIVGSRVIVNIKNITNHILSTLETRTMARDFTLHQQQEFKNWKKENSLFDE